MQVKTEIKFPKFHKNQQFIIDNAKRFNVLNCGRRFGKNVLLEFIHAVTLLKGGYSAHIEPTYGSLDEVFTNLKNTLEPLIKHSHSMKQIELKNGGRLDFWSLENYNAIRGKKYHNAVINEAAFSRNLKNAWTKTIRPTLADFKGSAWFASTPNGYNYFKELSELHVTLPLNWQYFHFTSYDNPFIDPEEIEDAKNISSELVFRQEWLSEFIEGGGTMLASKFIKTYQEELVLNDSYDVVMAVDLAISQSQTADYTAMVVLAKSKVNDNIYVIDIVRERLTFHETLNKIQELYDRYNPRIIGIETVAYQTSVFQELIRTTNLPLLSIKPDKDKITRFLPILGRYEHGFVYHNKNLVSDFKSELLNFPLGEHDDMVDALSYAYLLINQKIKKSGMYI